MSASRSYALNPAPEVPRTPPALTRMHTARERLPRFRMSSAFYYLTNIVFLIPPLPRSRSRARSAHPAYSYFLVISTLPCCKSDSSYCTAMLVERILSMNVSPAPPLSASNVNDLGLGDGDLYYSNCTCRLCSRRISKSTTLRIPCTSASTYGTITRHHCFVWNQNNVDTVLVT